MEIVQKLSQDMGPSTQVDEEALRNIPYLSVVGILMYEIVCMKLHIFFSITNVSDLSSNVRLQHWETIKMIFTFFKGIWASTSVREC
jgi:hypothetical protein